MKLSLAIVLATLTAACAGVSPDANAQAPREPAMPAGPPANYRKIIIDGVRLTPPALLVGAQVSQLRKTQGPQLGEWMACLKTVSDKTGNDKTGKDKTAVDKEVGYFAVFFEDNKVLTVRRAIAVDDCPSASYSPLVKPAPPAAAKKPPAKRKPPKGK
jgi:hypothetical protein